MMPMPPIDRFEFRPYCRPFQQPLHTHHGVWRERQGIILRLTMGNGAIRWGEVAPLTDFGTESWATAIEFCQRFSRDFRLNSRREVPPELPACQFGFGMLCDLLWDLLWDDRAAIRVAKGGGVRLPSSRLLPSGEGAIAVLQQMQRHPEPKPEVQTGVGTTFKWKIGITTVGAELEMFQRLVPILPQGSRLRLDANGGLDWIGACQWLDCCDRYRARGIEIEFLEQPLPPTRFTEMVQLAHRFSTPLALDESVATLEQLQQCYDQGWRGIFVIKAAIAGDPQRLLNFIQTHQLDVVWSSVFETAIARRFVEQQMIPAVPDSRQRAIGFGVSQWFADGWDEWEFEQIWRSIE